MTGDVPPHRTGGPDPGRLPDRHGLGATPGHPPESSTWENIGPPGTHRPILFTHKGERLLIWRSSEGLRKHLASTLALAGSRPSASRSRVGPTGWPLWGWPPSPPT